MYRCFILLLRFSGTHRAGPGLCRQQVVAGPPPSPAGVTASSTVCRALNFRSLSFTTQGMLMARIIRRVNKLSYLLLPPIVLQRNATAIWVGRTNIRVTARRAAPPAARVRVPASCQQDSRIMVRKMRASETAARGNLGVRCMTRDVRHRRDWSESDRSGRCTEVMPSLRPCRPEDQLRLSRKTVGQTSA